MRGWLASLFVMVISSGVAHSARVPAPDPSQGDGGVSPFYTWTSDVPDAPGQLLRTEPLDPTLGLAMAGQQLRILYSSTDGTDDKTPIAVSGAYFERKGTVPAGGGPLLAGGPGTTGLADIC